MCVCLIAQCVFVFVRVCVCVCVCVCACVHVLDSYPLNEYKDSACVYTFARLCECMCLCEKHGHTLDMISFDLCWLSRCTKLLYVLDKPHIHFVHNAVIILW